MKTVKDYNNLSLNSLNTNTNTKKISTVLFYQVCADTVKAKQSTSEYGRRLCLFLPIKHVDLRASDLESSVRVTCDVGYLCANFGRLRPNVRDRQTDKRQIDRQTDVRQHHRLMSPPIRGGG